MAGLYGQRAIMVRGARERSATVSETLAQLLWTGGRRVPVGRMLVAGGVVWALCALVQLAVHGPVIDEAVLAVQILSGAVRYPAGHPLDVFIKHAFTLGYWLAALVWWIHPSVIWVAAIRNVLFFFASAFVPFALVVVLTGRPAWGHVGAVLTLSETACRFVGVYLLWVFPSYYSSGHLGIHAALLTAVLLVGRCWLAGGLLLGALPALHGAMALLLWPWALAFLLLGPASGRDRRVVATAAAGALAVCVIMGVGFRLLEPTGAPVPPYGPEGGDPTAILRTFIATTDPHRRPIELLKAAHLVSPMLFAAISFLLLSWPGRRPGFDRAAAAWLVGLGSLAWGMVYGTRLVQALFGELPLPIAMLMPGRYANLVAPCLLPLAVVALARFGGAMRAATGAVALAVLALEAVSLAIDRSLACTHLGYVFWGAWIAVEWGAADSRRRPRIALAAGAITASLVIVAVAGGDTSGWSFMAGVAGGAAVVAAARAVASGARIEQAGLGTAVVLACVVATGISLRGPYVANQWDAWEERTSPYERELSDWLAAHAAPNELLLTPLLPPLMLQPKVGHPVLLDPGALLTMTYMRSLATPVAHIVRDVFDIDYTRPDSLAPLLDADGHLPTTAWLQAWPRRTCSAWIELRRRFQMRLVLTPKNVPLDLLPALPGVEWTLYEIPDDPARCPQTKS